MKKTLLAMSSLPPECMAALEGRFKILRLNKEADPEAVLREHSADVVGLLSAYTVPVTRRLIEAFPNLEIVAVNGVGFDHVDLVAAQERGVVVTNTPGVLTDETADTALSLILAVAKRVCEADMYVRVGKWLNGPMPLGTSLYGKTVGIVGLGGIGQAIARRCEAFEMNVVYHGPREKPDLPYMYYADVKDMAMDCDFLVLACPGGAETKGMIDYEVLEALGPKGFLINIARGSVVNEEDLVLALKNRVIAGAGLDVYAREPHVPQDLISMDNVVLLPHIGSATIETRGRMAQLVVDNLLAHFDGQPLKTPVAA